MGCLFGKKGKTITESESEISQDVSIKLEPQPFNNINDNKFYGYPNYIHFTKQMNIILQTSVSDWKKYEQQLEKEKEKINSQFNYPEQQCLIVDIQTGTFQSKSKEGFYYVMVIVETQQPQMTTALKSSKFMQWNEVFQFNGIKDLNSNFKLQIMQQKNIGSEVSNLGHSITFNFTELKEQLIIEKAIRLKEGEEIIGILQIKCQLIYNIKEFALNWMKELTYRIQQIDRVIQKSQIGPNENDIQFQSLMSFHSNRMNNETVYGDLQYEIS